MTTLFIADIHLSDKHPHLTHLFNHFLTNYTQDIDALYILGDLFNAWIGDDDTTLFHTQIIQALQATTAQGTPVYIMAGNRDFLLGKKFSQMTGCQLLPDPSIIELYGEKVLLKHGDDLCTDDKQHQYFRRITRQPWVQSIYLGLPVKYRRYIANTLRTKSQKRGKKLSMAIMDANTTAIKQTMQQHTVNHLIHGHTHRPSIHYFYADHHWKRHIVLSDWNIKGNYLAYHSDGKVSLNYFIPIIERDCCKLKMR